MWLDFFCRSVVRLIMVKYFHCEDRNVLLLSNDFDAHCHKMARACVWLTSSSTGLPCWCYRACNDFSSFLQFAVMFQINAGFQFSFMGFLLVSVLEGVCFERRHTLVSGRWWRPLVRDWPSVRETESFSLSHDVMILHLALHQYNPQC